LLPLVIVLTPAKILLKLFSKILFRLSLLTVFILAFTLLEAQQPDLGTEDINDSIQTSSVAPDSNAVKTKKPK